MNGYSKALMGFDFADVKTLFLARKKFSAYLQSQGVPIEVAEPETWHLHHSWEFAAYEPPANVHYYHLPGQHDQCDHSVTGECEPVESGGKSSRIEKVKGQAFTGRPVRTRKTISKLETGHIAEAITRRLTGASVAGRKGNNFAVDATAVGANVIYEVKAGLVSNGADAQKWRVTLGEPGAKEKAWLEKASASAKAEWNSQKLTMALERKQKAVSDLSRAMGRKFELRTAAYIINPDTKMADFFEFKGAHSVIRWNSDVARRGYRFTVKYG